MSIILTYNISNVKCAGCVAKVEGKLTDISGVHYARVNLLDKTLMVEYTNRDAETEVVAGLNRLGYPIEIGYKEESFGKRLVNIILPIVTGATFIIMGMFPGVVPDYTTLSGFLLGGSYSVLSLLIIIICGYKPLQSGLRGILHTNLNMYSLILIGVVSAWIYSVFIIGSTYYLHLAGMQHVYFESALIIIGLVNLGAYLEDKAKAAAQSSIQGLTELLPLLTTVVVEGVEQKIASNRLRNGDFVKIKPGEKLPADGVIISGDGYLDEAMLNGEPLPVHKKSGDKVFGGTLNHGGSFLFSVTEVGGNTLLGDIIQLVKTAQLAKPRLANLADIIAKFFIPIVIGIAIFSGLLWYFLIPIGNIHFALTVFMTVLIIACPCSVGLAIPASLAVGVGRAATLGVIIRDSSGFDVIDKINTVALDKTGTITMGKPQVVTVDICSNHQNKEQIFSILYSLENNSEHPLAAAIIEYTTKHGARQLDLSQFTSYPGRGVSAMIAGNRYIAGSLEFIADQIQITRELVTENNHTNIYFADDKQILARIDISDMLKPDSQKAVEELQLHGYEVIMLTGDNPRNANFIADQVGIHRVIARCLPDDKVRYISELQKNGNKVIFVGDGINDAPSLAQADFGIALGNASDIARQGAPVSLLGNSLAGILTTIKIIKKINQNMRQNLFGSFIYNLVAISVAAGVFYPIWHILLDPMLACLVMSLSSLTVIINALRLRYVKID